MTTHPRTSRVPNPVYAAAGAGDLALEQLRRLPAIVTELSGRAVSGTNELREKAVASLPELREKAAASLPELRERAVDALRTANTTATGLRDRAARAEFDPDRLRAAAIRNAAFVVSSAHAASERAAAAYDALVIRGERVVSGGPPAAGPVRADVEVGERITPSTGTAGTQVEANKPAKTTRAAKAAKAAKGTEATGPQRPGE